MFPLHFSVPKKASFHGLKCYHFTGSLQQGIRDMGRNLELLDRYCHIQWYLITDLDYFFCFLPFYQQLQFLLLLWIWRLNTYGQEVLGVLLLSFIRFQVRSIALHLCGLFLFYSLVLVPPSVEVSSHSCGSLSDVGKGKRLRCKIQLDGKAFELRYE